MNKDMLKNGYKIEFRGQEEGYEYYILGEDIIKKSTLCSIEIIDSINGILSDSLGNLRFDHDYNVYFITKIFDNENNLIWEKINFEEIPLGTKVLVRDLDTEKWEEALFLKANRDEDYPFHVMDESMRYIYFHKQCKLME